MNEMDRKKLKEELARSFKYARQDGHYPLGDSKTDSLEEIGKRITAMPGSVISFITCGFVANTEAIPSLSDDDLIEAYLFIMIEVGTYVDQVMFALHANYTPDDPIQGKTLTTMGYWLRKLTFKYLADHSDFETSLYAIGELARLSPEKTTLLRRELKIMSIGVPTAQEWELLNAFEAAARFCNPDDWSHVLIQLLAKPGHIAHH